MKNSIRALALTASVAFASSLVPSLVSSVSAADAVTTTFDASNGQLPEGLAVTKDALFVGIAGSGEVWKVSRDGKRELFGKAPAPVEGKGFLTGVIVAPNGDVLAALASFAPEVQAGLYRIPKTGGKATLFSKHAEMGFPNGLVYEKSGDLLVTDSNGSVFRVQPNGEARVLVRDEKLTGDKSGASSPAAPGAKFGLNIGANGIALSKDGEVYVANSDRGTLVKFRIEAKTGAAGAIEVVAQDPARLGGADGIAVLDNGDVVVAVNTQDKLVRVSKKGTISDVKVAAKLDFPASVALDPASKGKTVFVTNAGFLSQAKQPSVVKVTLD